MSDTSLTLPIANFAGFDPCFLVELSTEYYYLLLCLALVTLVIGLLLINSYRSAVKGNPRQWRGLLIVIQLLAFATILDSCIRIGSNLLEDGCKEATLIPLFTLLLVACTVLLYVLYKATKLQLNIELLTTLVVVSLWLTILLYAPIYNSYNQLDYRDWRKYPVWYRCLIHPLTVEADQLRRGGYRPEPFTGAANCMDFGRY